MFWVKNMAKEIKKELDSVYSEIQEVKTRLFEIEQMAGSMKQRLERAEKALNEIYAFYKL